MPSIPFGTVYRPSVLRGHHSLVVPLVHWLALVGLYFQIECVCLKCSREKVWALSLQTSALFHTTHSYETLTDRCFATTSEFDLCECQCQQRDVMSLKTIN